MKFSYTLGTLLIGSILLTGGCSQLEKDNERLSKELETSTKKIHTKENREAKNDQQVVRVQDYTGIGLELPNSNNNNIKIAKQYKNELENAVKSYFEEKYKTNVIIHNIVGNRDGVTVFVESADEPHFHTFAIVPISNNKVITSKVSSLDGQVEDGIDGGLYAMIYEEKFKALDKYLQDLQENLPVIGRREEAINNTSTTGYTKSEYYITSLDKSLAKLRDRYINDPEKVLKEIDLISQYKINPSDLLITIQLYMKEEGVKPDPNVHKEITEGLKEKNDLPPGNYVVYLNDNKIYPDTGTGSEDNFLESKDGAIIIE